jgi:hypothetical protein
MPNSDFEQRVSFVQNLLPDATVIPLTTVSPDSLTKFLQ